MLQKRETTIEAVDSRAGEVNSRRLRRVFWACEIGMPGGYAINYALEQWFAAWICGASALALWVVPWLVARGRSDRAAHYIILVIFVTVGMLVWFGRGLHDEAQAFQDNLEIGL